MKGRYPRKRTSAAVKQESHLEAEFKLHWLIYGQGIPLDEKANCQLKVIPGRAFRFDFGWIWQANGKPTGVLVEIHGGLYGGWSRGRHVQPRGYSDDRSKVNQAVLLGYTVLEYTSHWFTGEVITGGRKVIKEVERRDPENMIGQIVQALKDKGYFNDK